MQTTKVPQQACVLLPLSCFPFRGEEDLHFHFKAHRPTCRSRPPPLPPLSSGRPRRSRRRPWLPERRRSSSKQETRNSCVLGALESRCALPPPTPRPPPTYVQLAEQLRQQRSIVDYKHAQEQLGDLLGRGASSAAGLKEIAERYEHYSANLSDAAKRNSDSALELKRFLGVANATSAGSAFHIVGACGWWWWRLFVWRGGRVPCRAPPVPPARPSRLPRHALVLPAR